MKKIIILFVCICGFIFSLQNAAAQSCSSSFTVNTAVTNSTCQANGKIKVTLSGNLTNLTNIQYILETDPPSGIPTVQNTDEFLNVAPGTYKVTVRAFCAVDAQWEAVKEVSNVVVGGNYQPPLPSLNSTVSRKSYTTCNTGIIALNVTGGNGTFTFTAISVPLNAPVAVPQTLGVTKNGNVYTLNGQNWPRGKYEIQVADSCYSAMATFTLDSVLSFPNFYNANFVGFRPDLDNAQSSGCNVVGWLAYSTALATNPDHQRYFNDGLYEIGSSPTGQAVSNVTNWVDWTTNSSTIPIWLNLGTNTINDFYSTSTSPVNKIVIYTRLKGCPNTYTSFQTYIYDPPSYAANPTISTPNCSNIQAYPQNGSYGVLCYPLTLTVTQNGSTTYSKSGWLYNANLADQIPINYSNGKYTVKFEDKMGTIITTTRPTFSYSYNGSVPHCNNYYIYHSASVTGASASCYPWLAVVTATEVGTGTVAGQDTIYNTASVVSKFALNYGIAYTLSILYADGTTSTYSPNINVPVTLTTTFTIGSVSSCAVDLAYLYVYGQSLYFPIGTIFNVTGPNGFSFSTTTTTITSYVYVPSSTYTTLTPGLYTLKYYTDGDMSCERTLSYTYNGGYNYVNFGYDSVMVCGGMKITPKGSISYMGTAGQVPYFRFTSGPPGYYTSAFSLVEPVTLYTPGEYVLGIMVNNNSTGCVLGTVTINYTAKPLALDPSATSAYFCVGGSVGHIFLSAANGVAPYSYELWDESNQVQVVPTPIVTSGVAHFAYGSAGVTYTVRVKDNCNNSFSQKVTVSDLQTAKIVYVDDNKICTGGTLELKCTTLGATTYSWTGPNSYTSPDQNPVLVNVNSNMAGWYKVEVTPQYCGLAVKDSIYIDVYDALSILNSATDYTMCSGSSTVPEIIGGTVSGGSGGYTYQWQWNYNSGPDFYDVSGAVSANYTPTSQMIADGKCYFRLKVNNTCGTIYSNIKHVIVKPCGIPVNPILMNKAQL